MAEIIEGNGGKPASELAHELLPYLEATANLHYVLDWYVTDPARLKEVRILDDRPA